MDVHDMKNEGGFLSGAVMGAFITAWIFLYFGDIKDQKFKEEAIKAGAAEHNAITGEFEWIQKTIQ